MLSYILWNKQTNKKRSLWCCVLQQNHEYQEILKHSVGRVALWGAQLQNELQGGARYKSITARKCANKLLRGFLFWKGLIGSFLCIHECPMCLLSRCTHPPAHRWTCVCLDVFIRCDSALPSSRNEKGNQHLITSLQKGCTFFGPNYSFQLKKKPKN